MNQLIWIFFVLLFCTLIESLEFGMIFMTKCITEIVPANSQVELEYSVYDFQDVSRTIGIRVQVENPDGISVHSGAVDSANITFRSSMEGDYKACFTVKNNAIASRTKLKLEWRIGAGQIDWDEVAKKEHLDEIDTIMERFKTAMKEVSDELKELRVKEKEMREITEATNTRVTLFSILCMVTCVTLSACQVWYLRRFFAKKKII